MSVPRIVTHRLLDWLTQVAAQGERCPSNDAIAGRFGFESSATSARQIATLEAEGKITVERFQSARVVTIVATGASTARPIGAKPHKTKSAAPHLTATPAKPRVSAAVIRAAKIDGRDLPTFVTALIDMGLECWRDDRVLAGEALA